MTVGHLRSDVMSHNRATWIHRSFECIERTGAEAPRCARDEQLRGTLLAARQPDAPPRDRSANGDVSQ